MYIQYNCYQERFPLVSKYKLTLENYNFATIIQLLTVLTWSLSFLNFGYPKYWFLKTTFLYKNVYSWETYTKTEKERGARELSPSLEVIPKVNYDAIGSSLQQ